MAAYLARLFYLGDKYHGSQFQPNLSTIQGELINALTKWSGELHNTQTVQLSGRTDRGVHSIGQIVMIHMDHQLNIEEINRELPEDIVLWASSHAPSFFKPRYSTLMRHYRYYLDKEWRELDLQSIRRALDFIIGSNDFSLLSKPDTNRKTAMTVLNASVSDKNTEHIALDIFGTNFLWKFIRKLVTLLNWIGAGKYPPEIAVGILAGNQVIQSGIQPAPSERLVLVETIIPVRLNPSKYALRSIQTLLKKRVVYFKNSAKVLSALATDYFSDQGDLS